MNPVFRATVSAFFYLLVTMRDKTEDFFLQRLRSSNAYLRIWLNYLSTVSHLNFFGAIIFVYFFHLWSLVQTLQRGPTVGRRVSWTHPISQWKSGGPPPPWNNHLFPGVPVFYRISMVRDFVFVFLILAQVNS